MKIVYVISRITESETYEFVFYKPIIIVKNQNRAKNIVQMKNNNKAINEHYEYQICKFEDDIK